MQEFNFEIFCCAGLGCGKVYNSKYNLIRHIKINHLKAKTGKCDICEREFVSVDNLKEHMYIHMNIKPFECNQCGVKFRNKCMLVRHKRSHLFTAIDPESNS